MNKSLLGALDVSSGSMFSTLLMILHEQQTLSELVALWLPPRSKLFDVLSFRRAA
jgi:hypothetical protein